jgi:hypothetical protein
MEGEQKEEQWIKTRKQTRRTNNCRKKQGQINKRTKQNKEAEKTRG